MIKFFLLLIIYSILLSESKLDVNEQITTSRENAITKSIDIAASSVVGINVTKINKQSFDPFFDPFFDNFFRQRERSYKVKKIGSGVIISSDGYIITNSHVVENAVEIIVSSVDNKTYEAIVIGNDELTDLALIKINSNIDFNYANLGNSDDLIVGEWVVALGNPLGLFDISNKPTATAGIISGVGLDFGQKESGKVYQNMLQTDASINPGNSGGPLINVLGEVIGINTFIMTNSNYTNGSIGIGFAIPINTVQVIISELKKYGKIERNFTTGLHVQKIDKMMIKTLKIDNKSGVIITNIDKGSSGEKADLHTGDIILGVNGISIANVNDILKVIDEGLHKVGDYITLNILRYSKEIEIDLKLDTPKENKVTY